jgi:hypothetical protein
VPSRKMNSKLNCICYPFPNFDMPSLPISFLYMKNILGTRKHSIQFFGSVVKGSFMNCFCARSYPFSLLPGGPCLKLLSQHASSFYPIRFSTSFQALFSLFTLFVLFLSSRIPYPHSPHFYWGKYLSSGSFSSKFFSFKSYHHVNTLFLP